jgi:hypothetical protein
MRGVSLWTKLADMAGICIVKAFSVSLAALSPTEPAALKRQGA